MDVWVIVLLIVVLLHFLVGFGVLMYKLSPKKKNDDELDSKLKSK